MMLAWPALLLAPLLALAQQSITYSLATPSCRHQEMVALHAVPLATLLLILLMTAMAAWSWHARRLPDDNAMGQAQREDTRALRRRRFVAAMGTVVGLISALVSLAMWFPVWVLSPCAG